MDSLEKLFLSCLVLFGMFILFLFGLYFDLGDMLASQFHRDERAGTGVGITDNLIRQMEDRARPHEVMPTHLDLPTFGGADDNRGAEEMARAALRYNGAVIPPISGKTLTALKRANLQAQGITREEVLDLESLGDDREESSRVVHEVTRLCGEKRYAEAEKLLADQIAKENPKNLLVLRDLLNLQVQVYLDGKQVDKAREAARKMYETLDRIIAIRTIEGPRPELQQELTYLKGEKERLDKVYQDLQKRMEETGSPTGLTASEKAQMKEAFTRTRNEGKMTEDEYRKALKELES